MAVSGMSLPKKAAGCDITFASIFCFVFLRLFLPSLPPPRSGAPDMCRDVQSRLICGRPTSRIGSVFPHHHTTIDLAPDP